MPHLAIQAATKFINIYLKQTFMQKGDKAILIPGKHNVKWTGSTNHKSRVLDVLKSMSEEVTIIKVNEFTGNAKVRDVKDMVFYCNIHDLRPFSVNV